MERVLVAGISGAGKTTMAERLAGWFGLPRYELDALYHGPGWQPLGLVTARGETASNPRPALPASGLSALENVCRVKKRDGGPSRPSAGH